MLNISDFITADTLLMSGVMKVSIRFLMVIFVTILLEYLFKYINKKTESGKFGANIQLISALKNPLIFFLWGFFAISTFTLIETSFDFNVYNFLFFLKTIIVGCGSVWLASSFINQYAKIVVEKREVAQQRVDYGFVEFTKKICLMITIMLVLMMSLQRLGIKLGAILTIGGIGGLAVGFAAKDFLSNLFGGLVLYLDKPFTVGDWISSPEKHIEGIVQEIGWRETKIATFSNYPIYLPNFIFTGIIIENKSRMPSRKITDTFSIRFCDADKASTIVEEIKAFLNTNQCLNKKMGNVVIIESISNSALEIYLQAYSNLISFAQYKQVRHDIFLKVIEIIKKNGAELTSNTVVALKQN